MGPEDIARALANQAQADEQIIADFLSNPSKLLDEREQEELRGLARQIAQAQSRVAVIGEAAALRVSDTQKEEASAREAVGRYFATLCLEVLGVYAAGPDTSQN